MAEMQLTVVIEATLAAQAEAAAAQRGETLDDVVRTKLQEYVAETQPVDETQQANHTQEFDPKWVLEHDPLLSLRFRGPGNVARRYKEILTDASEPKSGFRIDNDHSD